MTAATAAGLCEFIDASPSPFHVCRTVADRLRAAGYTELVETDRWADAADGRFFVLRAGSLVAWNGAGRGGGAGLRPFRIVGGHTDSPNLRVKQHPDLAVVGWKMIALQPYGGAWLNSWLDRDLGLSGRISLRGKDGELEHRLVRFDEPLLRVPQLAIHLAEDRNTLSLNPQRHLNAVWGAGDAPGSLWHWLADRADVRYSDLLAADLMTHVLEPSRLVGANSDLVSAPRLDNQGTCYAGVEALLAAEPEAHIPMLALFDHEEVGSTSDHGAQSEFLVTTMERIVLAAGGDREDFLRLGAGSIVASGDMAHATHPNYPERHEPGHLIYVNRGPVLKVQPNLRYATDSRTAAAFELACRQAGVPLQRYEHRADLPCGSTIGPMTAARTGIPTVDVGAPQLAMHSSRELMGAVDVAAYAAALSAFLAPH